MPDKTEIVLDFTDYERDTTFGEIVPTVRDDTPPMLTKRWRPMTLLGRQRAFLDSEFRFNVLPGGRRSGKTELAKRRLVKKALKSKLKESARFIAGGPTYSQAKRIYWKDLKAMVPPACIARTLESDLTIELVTGHEIVVMGLDVPERLEGSPVAHILMDECPDLKPRTWTEHGAPALADTAGTADFIGVPEGLDHFYDWYQDALKDETGEWGAFHWTSEEALPLYLGFEAAAIEIESAKRRMDSLSYRQEFLASFVNFQGRAYYSFEKEVHVRAEADYVKGLPLILMLDFNVDPGIAVIGQEVPEDGTRIFDEIWIDKNSNTARVCQEFVRRWRSKHDGVVHLYGDASGGNRSTSGLAGSDWDIVNQVLQGQFHRTISYVGRDNPPVRARVNSVNCRLKPLQGKPALFVHPRCPRIIKDLEGVTLKSDGSGQIDKPKGTELTHVSDALGYYIAQKFPLIKRQVEVTQI